MNVLVTSSRMPFALDEIRKLGRAGHRVYAADTFATAPGGRSRFVTRRFEVASPRYRPLGFLADVKQIVLGRAIDLVVPCFEEVFYLAAHLEELDEVTRVFCPPLDTLARLHHKGTFIALARALGIPVPPTTEVTSDGDLAAAVRRHPEYIAKAAWSRAGLALVTNAGPLAGASRLEDCTPSPESPWVVQPYVHGLDVCSFSVAQHGRVVAHASYVHPVEIDGVGGIVYESVEVPEALEVTQRIVEATGYHGQISIDFRHDGRDLYAIECNPRPTAGVVMMPGRMFVDAVMDPRPGPPQVAPAGVRRMIAAALVRDMLRHRGRVLVDLGYLLSDAADVFAEEGDRLPALYQILSYGHVLAQRNRLPRRRRPGTLLVAGFLHDIIWDGTPIP